MKILLVVMNFLLPLHSNAAPALPTADSVIGSYTWDLLAPILNGQSPYSRNCKISINQTGGNGDNLSISMWDTDPGAEDVKNNFEISLSELNRAIVESDIWQKDNNGEYDGGFLPVSVRSGHGLGAKTMIVNFLNGEFKGLSIDQTLSTGPFNESSFNITCSKPGENRVRK